MKFSYIILCAALLWSRTLLPIFGFGKDKYLTQFNALREMEETLAEINDTNRKIIEAEKDIARASAKQEADLKKSIANAEQSLKDLSKKAVNDIKEKIDDLRSRIDRQEGDVKSLQKAITQENYLLKTAENLNSWALGWLSYATDYVRSTDEARKKDLENAVARSRKEIAKYEAAIQDEQKKLGDVFTSATYQAKAKEINTILQNSQKALNNVVVDANELRKAKIFNPYNKKADELLERLKQQIKTANCDTIKTIADTKQRNIDACKEKALANIKKSFSQPACQSLKADSSLSEIQVCIAASKGKTLTAPGGPNS